MRREELDGLVHGEGWDPLDPNKPGNDAQRAAALEVAARYKRVFVDNDDGRWILSHLIRATIMRPTVRPGEDIKADGVREGRADLVRQFMFQIELAATGGNIQTDHSQVASPRPPRPPRRPKKR